MEAFGSFFDTLPYNGWLFAYTAQGTGLLHQVGIFCTSPDKGASSIWQSGAGPAVDSSGYIYVSTANGPFDLDTGGRDAGDSVLKLTHGTGGLTLVDYFTPSDEASLNSSDLDLGSGGPVIAPFQSGASVPNLVLLGAKDANLYLINSQNLGRFNSSTNSNVETVSVGRPEPTNGLWGQPAIWQSSLYLGEMFEPIKLFTFSAGLLSSAPSATTSNTFAYPGTNPVISSNSGKNSIVWALDVSHFVGYPNTTTGPAVLHAYNASNLQELYNSSQAGSRDTAGVAIKFSAPTVSNGRVYVGTAGELDVYGFLP